MPVAIRSERRSASRRNRGRHGPEFPRNDHIFKYALDCKKRGIGKDDALELAFTENDRCNPPLSGAEVARTVASAYRYEVSEVPLEIEEMNKTHAAIMVGGNCYVLNETINHTYGKPDFELLSVKGFKDFNCNRYVEVDGRKQRLGDAWFSHPQRKQYVGLTFDPKETPEGYYNMWKGFAVEPEEGDCSLYLKHIEENIANGDKAVYDYIIGWMAHTVQHPDVLLGTAIVLRGSMGTGKGVFADEFGKLFGRHYQLLSDSGQLVGRFNGHMKDKVVLLADEAFWAGDKQAEGKLKSMITEPTLSIEAKGKDIITVKNHLHMIFATNNEWSAPAGPRERRFFVIDVGEKHQQDRPYFKAITAQMNDGGSKALLYYLLNYDITGVDLGYFPQTAALRETKLLSFSPAQKFWHHILETGNLNNKKVDSWGNGIVEAELLYEKYITFVQDMGIRHKASNTELGIALSKMLKNTTFRKDKHKVEELHLTKTSNTREVRKNCYFFPTLAECRIAFEKFVNTKMDWLAE